MNEKQNKRFMNLIRQVHGLLENTNLQKQRDSQRQLGALLSSNKLYQFTGFYVNNLYCEWTNYLPKSAKPSSCENIILYCHGGGYMTGSSIYAREITTKLAKQTSLRILCFDYRLAPEFPYPAAIEDAFTIWNCITSCGYSANNIIIAGDSAGGNLSLVLLNILKEKLLPMPKCAILFSPWTDMTVSAETYSTKESLDPVLNTTYIKKAIQNYLKGQDCTSPNVSPLFADLHQFPPIYIQVGENEILLDDSRQLYKKLLSQNVYAKLDIFENMWHVFQMSPIKKAKDAMDNISMFLNEIESINK